MTKSQSSTIHIGNIGEHKISSMLSPYCIVRNVGQGKDTGIDLYCEILNKDLEPTLHFFCQVKTGKQHVSSSKISKDLDYWSNQPVPVFLFLLKYSDIETINNKSKIWVYDIPFTLAKNDASKLGQDLTRDVCNRFLICDEDNNKDKMTIESFLFHHVPFAYGLWYMRKFGLVIPNPEIVETPDSVFVGGISCIYREKILQSITHAKRSMGGG